MSEVVHKRKEANYLKAISLILADEITNVNISIPTVVGVKLSKDSSHIYVYVTFIDNPERSLEHLIKTEGYVRSRLAQSSQTQRVPAVHFRLDDTFEKGRKINEILEQIKKNENK